MPPTPKKIHPGFHLRPTNRLPAAFKQSGTFTLGLNTVRGFILWNLIGGVLFAGLGWVFLTNALALRPELLLGIVQSAQFTLFIIFGNLIAMAITIALHEMIHGLLLWAYTRTRPVFGIQLTAAYVAAPGWYLPRIPYFIVALGPLVVLTLAGYGLITIIPPILTLPLLFSLTTNTAGSIGDIAAVIWLLRQSGQILIEDTGDLIRVYSA